MSGPSDHPGMTKNGLLRRSRLPPSLFELRRTGRSLSYGGHVVPRNLAMTSRYRFAFPRRDTPELCRNHSPKIEGAGKAGCPPHPQPRVRNKTKHTSVVTAGFTGFTRPSLRNGFNSLFRALPGDRAFLPPSPAKVAFRELDANVGASGPHDFAVRTQRHSSFDTAASTASRTNVRDDRDTPLCGTGRLGI
jgi:hypothetical protein